MHRNYRIYNNFFCFFFSFAKKNHNRKYIRLARLKENPFSFSTTFVLAEVDITQQQPIRDWKLMAAAALRKAPCVQNCLHVKRVKSAPNTHTYTHTLAPQRKWEQRNWASDLMRDCALFHQAFRQQSCFVILLVVVVAAVYS